MKNWLIRDKLTIFFLIFIVFSIILFQALIPLWRNHLIVDVWVYYQRAEHFFTYRTISNLVNNEHLPGALFYFFIPSIVFLVDRSFNTYVWYFFLLSFIFLLAHIAVYRRINGYFGALIFLLILFFSGPIWLFRFELPVSLLVLLSIYLFKKKRLFWSSLLLGMATTVKVYPALILPYYLIIFFKNKEYEKLLKILGCFLLGVLIVAGAYFLIGGSLRELSGSFSYHALKPLGMESPITSVYLIFFRAHYQHLPELIGIHSVFGVNIDYLPVNLGFFNLLPLVIVLLFYLYIYYSRNLSKKFRIEIVFLIFLLFLIFSKNMNPQYLFWAFSLVPILGTKTEEKKSSLILILTIVLIVVLLTQYIYPILYTDLVDNFRKNNQIFTPVFYLLFLRNFLLFMLLIVSSCTFLFKKSF